jgi:hypothetical protein
MGWTVWDSNPGMGKKLCLRLKQTGFEAHPASYSMAKVVVSLGVKRSGRDVNYSPPSTTEVENEWSHTSTPLVPTTAAEAFNHT